MDTGSAGYIFVHEFGHFIMARWNGVRVLTFSLGFGPKLEQRQSVLFRLVDVGAELFAMTAAISRAETMARAGNPQRLR